jgi:hypothetical protein
MSITNLVIEDYNRTEYGANPLMFNGENQTITIENHGNNKMLPLQECQVKIKYRTSPNEKKIYEINIIGILSEEFECSICQCTEVFEEGQDMDHLTCVKCKSLNHPTDDFNDLKEDQETNNQWTPIHQDEYQKAIFNINRRIEAQKNQKEEKIEKDTNIIKRGAGRIN